MVKLNKLLISFFYEIMFILIVFVMIATYNYHADNQIWILFYVLSILFEALALYIFIKRIKDNRLFKLYISTFITAILFFGHIGLFFEIPLLIYIFIILLIASIVFIK